MQKHETWWSRRAQPHVFLRKKEQIEHPVRKMIVKEAVGVTLDVGCGTCIDFPFFKAAGKPYVGVDITEPFIRYARRVYPDVDARVAHAQKLPFPDRHFGTVYCKSLLEHLAPNDYKMVVREMWRCARKKMLISFYLAPSFKPTKYVLQTKGFYENFYSKKEIVAFLRGLPAFKNLRITEHIGYNNSALYVVVKHGY